MYENGLAWLSRLPCWATFNIREGGGMRLNLEGLPDGGGKGRMGKQRGQRRDPEGRWIPEL